MSKRIESSLEVMLNALSIGYHLRKIIEAEPDIITGEKQLSQLNQWIDWHRWYNSKQKAFIKASKVYEKLNKKNK